MAEPTSVHIEASDIFALGGSFIPQSATKSTELDHAKMKKANGDYEKFSDTFNETINVTVVYNFNADVGLGAALPDNNSINNGYLVTSISISTTAGEYPEITLEGHQHGVNPHITSHTYAIDSGIQTILTGAVGAYDFFSAGDTDACVSSSTYATAVNHVDDQCGVGDHFIGTSIEGIETIEVNYIGFITTPPSLADWTLTNSGEDDGNDPHDASNVSAEKLVTRTV